MAREFCGDSNAFVRREKSKQSARRASMKAKRLVGMILFLLAMAVLSFAQTVTVTVQGRVYDSSGAALPEAAVTAVNTATGLSRTTTASSMGDYQLPSLPPGDYAVTAEKTG